MTRRLYRWLVLLHPPKFRVRFGDELLCIFDEAGSSHAWLLLGDGITSLLRQWIVRSQFPLMLAALLGAMAQLALASFTWLGVIHRNVVIGLTSARTQAPHDAGLLLLLVAGVMTAFMLGATALATLCVRFCTRKTARSSGRPARGLHV